MRCMCDDRRELGICEMHDRLLLWELSNQLPTYEDKVMMGVYLGIPIKTKDMSQYVQIVVQQLVEFKRN